MQTLLKYTMGAKQERGLQVDMVGRGRFLYIFWRYNQIDDKLNVISEGKKRKTPMLVVIKYVDRLLKERKSNREESVESL